MLIVTNANVDIISLDSGSRLCLTSTLLTVPYAENSVSTSFSAISVGKFPTKILVISVGPVV